MKNGNPYLKYLACIGLSLFFLIDTLSAQKLELVLQAGHTWRVGTLAISKNNRLIASSSGSRGDGTVKIWDLTTRRLLRNITGHASKVNALVFSPDGRWLASGGGDDTIRIWEVESGREARRFHVPAIGVHDLKFSPDSRRLISVPYSPFYGRPIEPNPELAKCPNVKDKPGFCEAGSVTVWDVQEGRFLFNIDPKLKPLAPGEQSPGWNFDFSPDGKVIAVGVEKNEMQLWDIATQSQMPVLAASSAPFVFSTTGQQIATTSLSGGIVIWDMASRREVRRIDGIAAPVAFANSDTQVITSTGRSGSEVIKVWNIADGRDVVTLSPDPAFDCANCSLHFSPDGRWAVLGGFGEPKLTLWDLTAPQKPPRRWLGLSGPVQFSPDSRLLAAVTDGYFNDQLMSNKIWFFDLGSGDGSCIQSSRLRRVLALATSTPERLAVATGYDIDLWDLAAGVRTRTLRGGNDSIYDLAFSADGHWLISGYDDSNGAVTWVPGISNSGADIKGAEWEEPPCLTTKPKTEGNNPESGAGIWDMTTVRPLSDWGALQAPIAISPDGKKMASSAEGPVVYLWNLPNKTGGQIKVPRKEGLLYKDGSMVHSLAFSPNKRWLAVAMYGDPTITVWDIDSYQNISTLTGPQKGSASIANGGADFTTSNNIADIAFDPASGLLAAASEDGMVRLWNIENSKVVSSFQVDGSYPREVEFSSNGRYLAITVGSTVELWDASAAKRFTVLQANGVNAIAFANDDKIVFTGSVDGTTRMWETRTGKHVATLVSLENDNWAVTTPDGRFDASDGAMKFMHYSFGLEVIGLEQLKKAYYEPGLLQKLLGFSKEPLRKIVPLKDAKLPPDVTVQEAEPGSGQFVIKLRNRGGGIGRVQVFVSNELSDNIVSDDARDAKLRANPDMAEATLIVDLKNTNYIRGKENKISVVASNYLKEIGDGNIDSRGAELVWKASGEEKKGLPSLYAIVGGVSDYDGEAIDLRFAAKDADDFSNALRLGANRLFCPSQQTECLAKVNITTLSTSNERPESWPTKENFKKAFREIASKAKPEDIIVVYLSGHGVTLGNNTDTYLYLTKDADSAEVDDLKADFQNVAISNAELLDWLTPNIMDPNDVYVKARRRAIILDTCSAGNFGNSGDWKQGRDGLTTDQLRAMRFFQENSGTMILAGSSANRRSYETNRFNQGLLTYSLLEGMKGASLETDGTITVSKLFMYAKGRVQNLAAQIKLEQVPLFKQPEGSTFAIGRLTEADKQKIALQKEKPIFLRPLLFNPETTDDDLRLIPELRDRLDAESDFGYMRRSGQGLPVLVYVDDDSFPGGVRVTGTYTAEGDNVRVRALLKIGGKTVATLPEITAAKDKVVDQLLAAIREALERVKIE